MNRMITERMAEALDQLEKKWAGKRRPKAFYLRPDDWASFEALGEHPTVTTMFGNNPPRQITEPSFRGVPVRDSEAKDSRLYNHNSTGTVLPA